MNLLIDTHVAVWWMDRPDRISPEARAAISSGRNRVFLSVISVWEIGLKVARGKLRIPEGYVVALREDGFGFLDVRLDHVERAPVLPPHHADPFDRLLVAQAISEDMILVTRDVILGSYGIPILAA